MHKYKSFLEYIHKNYYDVLEKELKEFILMEFHEIELDGEIANFDIAEIDEIIIRSVRFTKSEIDKVEFECSFYSQYRLLSTNVFPGYTITDQKIFSCYFKGSFKKRFVLCDKEIEIIEDEEFNENLTRSLVPVISKDDYDKYATKFLKYFCPEALKTPTKLNVKKMLKDKGVEYIVAPLEPEVSGKIYFANDKVDTITSNGEVITKEVTPGTIVIDSNKAFERGTGALNNTLIHETVHWYFHRNYFEFRQLLDNSQTCAVCYKSTYNIEDKEIMWMEKQARSLAPRILMPKKMVLEKYNELTSIIDYEYQELPLELPITWKMEQMVERIAEFFGVSRASAKFRLLELGKMRADGVFNYNNKSRRYYTPYTFKKNFLKDHQTFFVSETSMLHLLNRNELIRNAIINKSLIHCNGLIVVNNPKYYDNSKNKLTEYALTHAHECCLVIQVVSEASISHNINKFSLCNSSNDQSVEAYIDEKQLNAIMLKAHNDSIHFETHRKNIPVTFGETVEYHCGKTGFSYEGIAIDCDISDRELRKLRNGNVNIKQITLLKFCIGLKLSYPYINDLLNKANKVLTNTNTNEDTALLLSIISCGSRLGFDAIYNSLKVVGKESILCLSKGKIRNIEANNKYKNKT